jgi:flagellin
MSAGTSLRTNVTTLKMALLNTSQGSSLLQVADGALNQITDILQRQKAIAVQAGSGSLTSSERTFLNQEFKNLTAEVQRLAEQTNFNGVNLLDGVLTKTVDATVNTTNADKATASLTFGLNAVAGTADLVVINGVTFDGVAGVPAGPLEFRIAATISETVSNLAATLNASTDLRVSSATYSASGNTLTITSKTGGVAGSDFVIGGTGPALANQWIALANNNVGVDAPDIGSYTNMFIGAGLAGSLGALNTTDSVVLNAPTGTAQAAFTTNAGVGGDFTVAITGGIGVQNIYRVTVGDSLSAIVDKINNGDGVNVFGTAVHGIKAKIVGSSGNYNIMLQSTNANNYPATANADITVAYVAGGGAAITTFRHANGVAMAAATSTPSTAPLAAANTFHNQISGLGKAGTTGVRAGDTVGIGVTGNSLVTDQNQTRSVSRVIFPPITSANLVSTLAPAALNSVTIQIGETASPLERTEFTFSNTTLANAGPNDIAIGATLEETIDNAVTAINRYSGNGIENYNFRQIRAYRDGQSLVIESVDYGATTRLDNAVAIPPIQLALANTGTTGIAITTATLANGTTGGVSASNVNNAEFIGKISGFKATHTGVNDRVNVELTVGNSTYRASNIDTTATVNTTIRLSSSDGAGYLDIELRAGAGTVVTSQDGADTFANRLDAAFSTLDFYQKRDVSSYTGSDPIVTEGVVTGSLLGTNVRMSDNSFEEIKLENISVVAPTGSAVNAQISFTINGEQYTSELAVGKRLSANQTFKFLSASDSNRFLEFTTGNTAIQLDTQAKADSFQAALEKAFGVGENNASLSFQVGATSSDSLKIGLNGVTSKDIGIDNLDVLTQASAALAADSIDSAINKVTAVRAEVGALQSRFNFAAANVESSIANQDSARGVLLDTDVAAESTAFATAQVQLQAGISVLAQANLLPQNLLKLIG